MSAFWQQSLCPHTTRTPPDDMGQALCGDCGTTVTTHLTPALLAQTFEDIKRNHSPYGRHSRLCAETDLGWFCAPDCTLKRPHSVTP